MYEIYYVTQITRSEWQERNARYNRAGAEGHMVQAPNAFDRAVNTLRQAFARLATRAGAQPFPATQPHAM